MIEAVQKDLSASCNEVGNNLPDTIENVSWIRRFDAWIMDHAGPRARNYLAVIGVVVLLATAWVTFAQLGEDKTSDLTPASATAVQTSEPQPSPSVSPTEATPSVTPTDFPSPENFAHASDIELLECDEPTGTLPLNGGLTLSNSRNPDEGFKPAIYVEPGDWVRLQLYLHNRNPSVDVRDVWVQFRAVAETGIGIPFEARVCTPDAPSLLFSATLQSVGGPIRVEFLEDTVKIRALIEGEPRTRDATNSAFSSALGASVGPVKANAESDLATVTVAVDIQVSALSD